MAWLSGLQASVSASAISGPDSVCANGIYSYSVTPAPSDALYAWSVTASSAGAVIIGDTNLSTVQVSPATSGSFSLECITTIDGVSELAATSVTVNDTLPPVFVGRTNLTVECGEAWKFIPPKAADVCAGTNITLVALTPMTNALCGNTFEAVQVWEATDPSNNTATFTQVVWVVDTIAPTLAGSSNLVFECGVAWSFIAPMVTDVCSGAGISTLALTPMTNALCGNSFEAIQVWQVADGCSNVAFFTQSVTVIDTTAPLLACVSNVLVECGEAWEFQPPEAFDLCSDANVTLAILATTTNQLVGDPVSFTRIWSATDACNNSNTCSQTITIVDRTPPQITCPAPILIECAGTAGTEVSYEVSASDACDANVTLVTLPASGSRFPLGTNLVVCLAFDASGNTNQCTFEVIVQDTTPPVLTCPPSVILSEAPRDSGGATLVLTAPTVMDSCDPATQLLSTHLSGQVFPVGITTVTWTAVDASGNSNSCQVTVRVIPYRLFVVTNTDDAGPGSLRQALLDANDAPDENLVLFDLPVTDFATIQLLSPLPPITSPTTIDGWSHSGSNAPQGIELVGDGSTFDGLVLQSGSNVIRGLALHGFITAIRIEGDGTNVIQGNYLGVDLSGTNAPGNSGDGISLASPRNLIGGDQPGTGNVISGNHGNGITLASANAVNNLVRGNIIGASTDGIHPLPNTGHGVFLTEQASRNAIGGNDSTANLIAFNHLAGVALDPSAGTRNSILANTIFENSGLGIDLAKDGVTANDANDSDIGPNGLQNYPILSDARSAAGVTVIEGELSSTPNTTFRLEFFLNDIVDPSNHGEGRSFIGAAQVTIPATGTSSFAASFPLSAVFTQFITATATDSQGNTSEFSPAVQVRTPPVIEAQPQSTNSAPGEPVTLCASASGTPPITYQWRLNGVNIPGATNACYTIPSAALADGGTYTVVVGNELDALASTSASLIFSGGDILNLPTGDHFADAVSLSAYGYGTNGIVAGDNGGATVEPLEPLHAGKPGGSSVWYRWCTPSGGKGIATFRTTGSTFDTLMAVYQGNSLSNLVEVASDEDDGGFYSSEVRFNAFYNLEENSCYYIAIDALGGSGGQFVLSWEAQKTPHMLPVILLPPVSQTVPLGSSVTFSNYSVPECAFGHLDCNHNHWEVNFNQKEKLTYQWYFYEQPIVGATNATLNLPSVSPQQLGDYRVRVFTPWQYLDSRKATLQVNVTGQESQPVLSVDKFFDVLFSNPLLIGVPESLPVLARGEAAASTVVRGFTGTQIFNTTGSATEPGEVICGVIGGASEWITLVPEQTGTLFLNTDGSSYDTVLAVFRRNPTNAAALEFLACDNNGGLDGKDSALSVPVEAGKTNYVLVDGVNGATGVLYLNYSLATTTILKIMGQTPEGANVVQVNGRPALNFSLQASTNLVNWTTLVTTNAPNGVFDYTDMGSIPLTRRYYRALILP